MNATENVAFDAPKEMRGGEVYTETVVWSPPVEYVNDAPYQLVIVDLFLGERVTGRILGDRVQIGDEVEFVEDRNGVPYFRKAGG